MIVIPSIVAPPNDPVTLTIIGATTGRVSWGAASEPVDSYVVYSNFGSGDPDFDTPWATAPGAATSATGTIATAGDWIFIVRSVKSGVEDDNFEKRVDAVVDDGPIRFADGLPNPVSYFAVQANPGGFFTVFVIYNTLSEGSIGRLVNVYASLESESIDFSSPEDSLIIPNHPEGTGGPYALNKVIGPLVENESFRFVVRVEGDEGIEEKSDLEVIVSSSDASPPDDLVLLEAELF